MKLITKLAAGVLLGIGVPIVLLAVAELANPKTTDKGDITAALCLFGIPPSALGSWLVLSGRRRSAREEHDRLQSIFFKLLKQGDGRITPLSFAMETGLTGELAKAYLDERAREFSANFDVDDEGNMFHRFNLGGVNLPGNSNTQPKAKRVIPGQPIAAYGHFDVILEAVPDVHKIAAMKVVRELTGLGYKDVKDLVEAAPTPLTTSVSEAVAQQCKEQLEAIGAAVSISTMQPRAVLPQQRAASLPLSAQGTFDVILEAVPGVHKIAAIKIVRELTGIGLKEAKDLVEAAPIPLQTGVSDAIAQQCKKQLESIGAVVMVIEN
ncbi:MAG: ribosomal protein L7/L12 [Stenomitos rutilans HA7619-LM2]|jgi:ribosomal protein L7/L12|nr:ribosomal protein L7/L12 [Stenomitos rutilans HA7619-LM2]